jgi:AGZA family xanthine/uracil permease-like MFS transporter
MKKSILDAFFNFSANKTSAKREVLAGTVSYFTIVYIIAVNSMILSEAGLPLDGAIMATILLSVVSCIMIGIWANVPIILVPGMGVNALFSYTMVQGMGLTWQAALAAVFVSGVLFVLLAFSRYSKILNDAIPHSLKEAITIGLGLFLLLLGLEKGGLVVSGEGAILSIGNISSPEVCATVLTLFVAFALYAKNVRGYFLLTILAGTILAYFCGTVTLSDLSFSKLNIGSYQDVFFALSFAEINKIEFWIAVFAMTMVLVFEHIGLVNGFVNSINKPERYQKAFRASSVSAMLSGLFGSSPTVATAETAAGIAAGGRTGFTSVVTGILFLLSILVIPLIKVIPNSAIAPILIIVGIMMFSNIKHLAFFDKSESIPAMMLIVMIPFTYSIPDGMAAGFILYPFMKIVTGKVKEISLPMYLIAALFLVYFIISY